MARSLPITVPAAMVLVLVAVALGADSPVDLLVPATQPGGAPASQPAASTPTFRVAVLLPLTGELAPFGQSARAGLELAAARANAAAGVAGLDLELLCLDTQSRSARLDQLVTRAVGVDKAQAIIGGVSGPEATVVRALVERRRVPFLVLNGNWRHTDPGRYTLNVGVSDTALVHGLAAFARNQLEANRAALLAEMNPDQTNLLADQFGEQFTRAGGAVSSIASFHANAKPADIAAELAAAPATDVIFAGVSGASLVNLAASIRQRRIQQPLLVAAPPWLPATPGPKAPGLAPACFALVLGVDDPDPHASRFLEQLRKQYPGTPSPALAAVSADALSLIVQAAAARQRVGGELRDRLVGLRGAQGVLGPMGFNDATAQLHRPIAIARWTDAASDESPARLVFIQRVWPPLSIGLPTTRPD